MIQYGKQGYLRGRGEKGSCQDGRKHGQLLYHEWNRAKLGHNKSQLGQ